MWCGRFAMHLIFLCTPAGGAYKNAAKEKDRLLKPEYTGLRSIRCRMGKYGEAYDSFAKQLPAGLKGVCTAQGCLLRKMLV